MSKSFVSTTKPPHLQHNVTFCIVGRRSHCAIDSDALEHFVLCRLFFRCAVVVGDGRVRSIHIRAVVLLGAGGAHAWEGVSTTTKLFVIANSSVT